MSSRRMLLAIYGTILTCVLTAAILSRVCKHDPTSLFFDPNSAYLPKYSAERKAQAEAFFHNLEVRRPFRRTASEPPLLCIGIPTVKRKTTQYLHFTLGTLFDSLSNDDRQEIVSVVLLASTNPQTHYAYKQRWLQHVADIVSEYNETAPNFDYLRGLEDNENYWVKAPLDYASILERCYDTGAPYLLIVEDDVIAHHEWYMRTKQALRALESRTDWYLRLFYAEEFLGWQSQNALVYAGWSVATTAVVMAVVFLVRSWIPLPQRRACPLQTLCMFSVMLCAVVIAFFFLAGRLSVFPLHNGIVLMDEGCCGQSLVFPRTIVPQLADWLQSVDGHADLRIRQFAEHTDLASLALVPSLFQHIGDETSHEADLPEDIRHGMSLAQRVWNIKFEQGR